MECNVMGLTINEPVIIILKNSKTGKFHPAIVTRDIPYGISVSMERKFSSVYIGHIVTYQPKGCDSFDEAKDMIENEIIHEVKDSRPCTTDFLKWDGNSHPSDKIFIEIDDEVLHLIQ